MRIKYKLLFHNGSFKVWYSKAQASTPKYPLIEPIWSLTLLILGIYGIIGGCWYTEGLGKLGVALYGPGWGVEGFIGV